MRVIKYLTCAMWLVTGVAFGAMTHTASTSSESDIGTNAVTIGMWADSGAGYHHYVEANGTQYVDGLADTFSNIFWTYSAGTLTAGAFAGTCADLLAYEYALTANEVAQLYLAPVDPQTGLVDANRGGAYYNYDVFTNQLASLPTPQAVQRWDTNGVDRLAFSSKLNSPDTATGNAITNNATFYSEDQNHLEITVNGTPIQAGRIK